MTLISKNVYIDKLDDAVNEYNNKHHRTIKMKPIEVKDNTYFDSIKEFNDEDRKFRTSKYKNILAKVYTSNCSEEVLLFHGHMLLKISMVKELLEHFMKKNYKKEINKYLG